MIERKEGRFIFEEGLARLRGEQFEQQLRLVGIHQSTDGGGEPLVVFLGPSVKGRGGHGRFRNRLGASVRAVPGRGRQCGRKK